MDSSNIIQAKCSPQRRELDSSIIKHAKYPQQFQMITQLDTSRKPKGKAAISTASAKAKVKARKSDASFKTFIMRVKKHTNLEDSPKLQVGSLFLEQLDNFLVHMIDLLEKELIWMSRMNKMATLTPRQLECAVKLCFPKEFADLLNEYGRTAVDEYVDSMLNSKMLRK